MPAVPVFVYSAEYQTGNGGYVCLKVCRYCADTVPSTSALQKHCRCFWAYAQGRLGVRERLFGRTQTVGNSVLRPCKDAV